MHSKGLLEKAERRGALRGKRERRPMPGMMLHQDGSTHAWLDGRPTPGLIVTLDDATNEIYSAFPTEREGTASTFRGLREVFGKHGLPMGFHTDRGSRVSTRRRLAARPAARTRRRSAGPWRLNPPGAPPVEMWTSRGGLTTVPQENRNRSSGQIACYQNRTG